MAVADILADVVQGAAGAAGNTTAQNEVGAWQAQRQQQRGDQLKFALAPLSQSLNADQTRLALYADPNDPSKPLAGKEKEYQETLDRMTGTIGQMRGILGQKPSEPNPVEAGAGTLLDKLHITNHLKNHVAQVRARDAAKYEGQNQTMAGEMATGALPYSMTPEGQKAASAQALEAERAASAERIEKERAASALAVANARKPAPKGLKALEQGGVAYGVEDQDTGKQYLASQLGANGDAPPEAKQIWGTIKQAQADKKAEADKKEHEETERQLRGLAAIAERMGQSEAFQEQMASFRSDETTYRTLDKQARDAQESADLYTAEATDPGNKSAFDTSLVTDYASILAKGGRKTQAEIAFAQKIGGLGLRTEAMFSKARSGELPPEMRKLYIDYLQAHAKSERAEADQAKPELPKISAPQGPTARKNAKAKSGGNQIIVVSPEDMK